MSELTLQRIPFTLEADNHLRTLKSRTGISPNILCRIGFCLSLEEPSVPAVLPDHFKTSREINRYTLLGKYDKVFVALLVIRILKDQISLKDIDKIFLAHIHRGVDLLNTRAKSVGDIGTLEPISKNNLDITH